MDPDPKNEQAEEQQEAPETGAEAPQEGEDKGQEEATQQQEEQSKEDELPEWARSELTRARNDAARYRTELRKLQQQTKDAKTPEEFEAAVREYQERIAALESEMLRERIARKYNLPDDLAELLKGDDENAIEEHAKRLQKYAAPAPAKSLDDLSGGMNPNEDEGTGLTPAQVAARVGRRRF